MTLDRRLPLVEAMDVGHNRWHPAIAPIAEVAAGEVVYIETRDGGDGQITADSLPADDIAFDIGRIHPMTGPFFVKGAEPGDLLEVELLDIDAADFAWSGVWPGGGGLMREAVTEPLVVKWHIEGGVARSKDLPGVRVLGSPFVGVIGVAPSPGRLQRLTAREADLLSRGGFVSPPEPIGAIPPSIGREGLRTMPPREIGGNLDIKDLVAGSRITLPVDVPGALLSIGDLHFAQGDGESYGTAIEMAGSVRFRCEVKKQRDLKWRPANPVIKTATGSLARDGRRYLVTTGLPLDSAGNSHNMDVSLAAAQALEEMANYLTSERGFTRSQAQVIISVAADLRISVVNNPPNALVSAALPLDLFEEG